MPKNLPAVAGWILLPLISFALGWALKPSGDGNPESDDGARGSTKSLRSAAEVRDRGNPGGSSRPDTRRGGRRAGEGHGPGGAARVLSQVQIERLGAAVSGELDPIKRRAAFAELLEGLTLGNARQIREQIAHLPADSPEFRDFHYAWGAIAGGEAVMNGAETPKPDMHAALAGWAAADPAAARDWFESLKQKAAEGDGRFRNRDYLKRGLIEGLANADINAATDFVLSLAQAGDRESEGLMGIVRQKLIRSTDPATAADWAASLPQGKMRSSSMERVARHYFHSDREEGAAWVESLAETEGSGRTVRSFGDEWAKRDPKASIDWLLNLPEGAAGRSEGIGSAFGHWARRDMWTAGEALQQMPPSRDRDFGIGYYAATIAEKDPGSAVAWAGIIEDDGVRERALQHAGRVYLQRDPESARAWLPDSGLSAESQQELLNRKR